MWLIISVLLLKYGNSGRFTSQGPLGGHWIFLSSAVMMNCAVSSPRCLALKANWRTLRDQAGSLYLLTGRMMFFSSVMILGSKSHIIFQQTLCIGVSRILKSVDKQMFAIGNLNFDAVC